MSRQWSVVRCQLHLLLALTPIVIASTAFGADVTSILELPPVPGIDDAGVAPLKSLLDQHIREFLDHQPYAPLVWVLGKSGMVQVFAQSADAFTALCSAYPYLSPDVQARVKSYLVSQLDAHPPYHKTLCFYDSEKSARRETFHRTTQTGTRPPALEIGAVWSLWLFAEKTGSYEAVKKHWPAIKPLLSSDSVRKFKIDPIGGHWAMNPTIAGLIAYVRLAERFDGRPAADAARAVLAPLLDQLDAYWQERPTAPTQKYFAGVSTANGDVLTIFASQSARGEGGHSATLACLAGMTPEIARHLSAGPAKSNILQLLTAIDHVGPTWYVSGSERWVHRGGENAQDVPDESPGIMLAKSLIAAEGFDRLKTYVDIPLCPGDFYYIQRLVFAIEAAGRQ